MKNKIKQYKIMDIVNDFNLRENADIIAMAIDAHESLDSTELKQWFDKKYAPKTETRVYVINIENKRLEEEEINCHNFNDEEFMDEAEKQGTVFTLNNFAFQFNNEEINSSTDFIRFINVPVSL